MDIERALRRRTELVERLERIEKTGRATWPSGGGECPGSASGHSSVDRHGRCQWCRRKLEAAASVAIRYTPTIDLQDVIDPLTLEPVDPHDRDGYKLPGTAW